MKYIQIFVLLSLTLLFSCNYEEEVYEEEDLYVPSFVRSTSTGEEFKGYLGGAFNIVVDGQSYSSTEEWYNSEFDRIEGNLEAIGYPGASFDFDAEVGFEDMWRNTIVNIQTESNTGFQSATEVNQNDGSFQMTLPKNAFGIYMIKSIKRLNLVVNEEEIFCYNFLGIAESYDLNPESKPIIISNFSTSITKYACDGTERGTIIISRLRKGDSLDFVANSIGEPDSFQVNPVHIWIYDKYYERSRTTMSNHISKPNQSMAFSCELRFDDEQKLKSFDNCSGEIIDIVNWNNLR